MTFISFAQNYEDVTLFRALKGVEKGFYIDVGAQDPIADSVTKAFYERGWRGINIEPVDDWFKKLLADRPEDHNLKVAAAAEAGTLKLYEVVGTGMSTVDASFAAKHAAAGFQVREQEVPARRLDDICDEVGASEIHFLKIDVEGAEGAVLAGIDLTRIRPWIIFLESTEPNSTVPTHEQWEELLTTRGYVFVHFDGLNRYYVPREREEQLRDELATPPNYFDHFIRYSEWCTGQYAQQMEVEAADARQCLQGLESELNQFRDRLQKLEGELKESRGRLQDREDKLSQSRARLQDREDKLSQSRACLQAREGELRQTRERLKTLEGELSQTKQRALSLESELTVAYHSRSWRITKPLREANLLLKQTLSVFKNGTYILTRLPRGLGRRVLFSALRHLQARPDRKARVVKLLSRFPLLDAHLHNFSRTNRHSSTVIPPITYAVPVPTTRPFQPWVINSGDHLSCSKPFMSALESGCRMIYYFVDHTILCPSNTGMQRVTRCLGRALLERGEQVRFVKWDAHHQQFILLNHEELAYLSQWHGPPVSGNDGHYPSTHDQPLCVGTHPLEEGHWLVVPEVPHITYQSRPVTLEVIMTAKRLGLRTAFVFYDAIPLRRPELAEMAPNHETYMQQLLLADLVVPISNWSARDLVSFFESHENATLPFPKIAAVSLPGESRLTPRVNVPVSTGKVDKIILSVGTIESRKNQVTLIHAFEKFCADHAGHDWQLVFVGNLHPDVACEIDLSVKRNSRIRYLTHIPDGELDELYRSCAFSVFPSVEEGFGLPILESLWYAKPCICADFGAMAEVAEGGGCLTVNVRNPEALQHAMTRMMMEPGLLERLSLEAANRPISTWADYAKCFIERIDDASEPINQLGTIYYWVDHTCTHPTNSGIQRVVRGLARALLDMGIKVVPVKWDEHNCCFYEPTVKELEHLAQWNGPLPSEWGSWIHPSKATAKDWVLIPELTTYLTHPGLSDLKQYASHHGLRCAWVFYDAIPWKMTTIYPPEATLAHQHYMEGLNEFELIFAISAHSRVDLTRFLAASRLRSRNLGDRIRTCLLPGEFREAARNTETKVEPTSHIVILCLGTIEPRKNHLRLLEAYAHVRGKTQKPLELIFVGSCPFPHLAEQVNHYIQTVPGIRWEQNVDDTRLGELYAECDFTVYPSLDEGFGLPILESLWHARPCICRDTGAMAEVAEGGGCLTVETADSDALAEAILSLTEDDELRVRLAREAVTRSFKTWGEYAREIATHLATERYVPVPQSLPVTPDKPVFYADFVNLKPRPLLSICITTYNRAEWLALSLSNLARLIPNPCAEVEIVVCDNTSTDNTPKVVKPYLDRTDFRYHRNEKNVGMLGNLRVTAHYARGQYIWLLGDDDLVKSGSIEEVLRVIQAHPGIALIYLNYAYTRQDDAKTVNDLDRFLKESTPIVTPGPDIVGPVHRICTESENFFTAIYCLVFRRDHALRAYSQNTDGRPFSTMLTCIPTTYYVLSFMMNEPAYWVGTPQLVVNMNVSWVKYAPLWILERIPEVYDLAEKMGASPLAVDRWRIHNLHGVMHFFKEIFEKDQEGNLAYFSPQRLVNRLKHLKEFRETVDTLRKIYNTAHSHGTPGAGLPPAQVFAAFENQ